jgi:hypothetical protein
MRILGVGDIHGRVGWRNLAEKFLDQVVFIGDYVDSRDKIEDETILSNFEDIINLKKDNPKLVTLLLGNHDIQYLHYPDYPCSGFRGTYKTPLVKLFQDNQDLFQIAFQQDKYLFTHAGVSQSWFYTHIATLKKYEGENLADTFNILHRSADKSILFEVGPARGGDAQYGGPVWADISETQDDFLPTMHQVVGHSRVDDIITYGDEAGLGSITYIDVLSTQVKFYEVLILSE